MPHLRFPSRSGLSRLALSALLACAPLVALHAQVAPGDTVRIVRVDGTIVNGLFVRGDSAALTVVPLGTSDSVRIAAQEYVESAVLRGHHRRGPSAIGHGAAVGAGVGLALGGLSLLGSTGPQHNNEGSPLLGAIALPIVGALIGAVHGSMMAFVSEPDWRAFDLR